MKVSIGVKTSVEEGVEKKVIDRYSIEEVSRNKLSDTRSES